MDSRSLSHRGLYIALCIGLLLLIAGLLFSLRSALRLQTPEAPRKAASEAATSSTSALPPFTDDVKAQLAASKGFQVLVSYTDRGFEPADASLRKGETVRFTNNSSKTLRVADVSDAAHSSTTTCQKFDSCGNIRHGEFWEYTFRSTGSFTYENLNDPAARGAIRVK